MDNKKIFADRLVELRESRCVTQQTLADDLEITRQSLSLYEKAQRTINIDLLVKIAKYFNVSTDYLLGLSENATTDTELQAVCDYTKLSEKAIQQIVCETKTGFDFNINALDWLISNNYIFSIASSLGTLGIDSQKYNEMKKNYDEKYGKLDNLHRFSEEENKMLAELGTLDALIDTDRYQLIKISEEMSNHFDQRKENPDNGNDNKKNE